MLGNWTSTLSNNSFNELRAYYGVNKLVITSNLAGVYGLDVARGLNATTRCGPSGPIRAPRSGASTTGGVEGETNFYFIDNFMFVKGKHQLKVGGAAGARRVRHGHRRVAEGTLGVRRGPRLQTSTNPTSYPYQLSLAIGTATYIAARTGTTSVFVQDTWQVRNDLTLNLGLRYDVDNTILVGNELVDAYNQRFVRELRRRARR